MPNWTGLSICFICDACFASVSTSSLEAFLRRAMRFSLVPEPYSSIDPELSSTSATSSVFLRRISASALKSMFGDDDTLLISMAAVGRNLGWYFRSAVKLERAAAVVVVGQDNSQRGVGRIDRTKIGFEEVLGIVLGLGIGGALGDAPRGSDAGGVQRVHRRGPLPASVRCSRWNRQSAHDGHHRYRRQQHVVAANILQKPAEHAQAPLPDWIVSGELSHKSLNCRFAIFLQHADAILSAVNQDCRSSEGVTSGAPGSAAGVRSSAGEAPRGARRVIRSTPMSIRLTASSSLWTSVAMTSTPASAAISTSAAPFGAPFVTFARSRSRSAGDLHDADAGLLHLVEAALRAASSLRRRGGCRGRRTGFERRRMPAGFHELGRQRHDDRFRQRRMQLEDVEHGGEFQPVLKQRRRDGDVERAFSR